MFHRSALSLKLSAMTKRRDSGFEQEAFRQKFKSQLTRQ